MDRSQRNPTNDTAQDPVARKQEPGAGHRPDAGGAVQRAPVPAGGPAVQAGAWEADDGLMDAMGMGEGGAVQRKRTEGSQAPADMEASASAGVGGGGGAVPHQDRMEQAFGTSFGGVNAHVGGAAADACDSIGAQAYAQGNDVAFKGNPDQGLVAHELTHVLQQRAGAQAKGAGESPALEAEADAVGSRVAAGQSVADITSKYTGGAAAASVQRKEAEGGAAPAAQAGGPDAAAGGGGAEDSDAGGGRKEQQDAADAGGGEGAAATAGGNAASNTEAGSAETAGSRSKKKPKAADDVDGGKKKDPSGAAPPPEAEVATPASPVARARDTSWGGNFVEVPHFTGVDGADFVGNVTPGAPGKFQVAIDYSVRNLYVGDTTAGIDAGGANVLKKGHDTNAGGGITYSASLPHTKPGIWSAWVHNPGGVFAGSMHAEEIFRVVSPVTFKSRKPERTVYDFENPIPIQMTGDSELKFKLSKSMVSSKRVGAGAGGSATTSASDKMSFGVALKLDNDAGSEGGAEWGMSSASSTEFKKQWNTEKYSSSEISGDGWMEATYHPTKKDKGRSKMLVPTYTWVEWLADVYPHSAGNLKVTGKKKEVTYGLLLPTGKFEELRSTDPGDQSDSAPTAGAGVDPTDMAHNPQMEKSYKDSLPQAQGWETMPGARWADEAATIQFIRGPIQNTPSQRDYGIQEGHSIHPGNDKESMAEGSSFSTAAEDGVTSSSSEENSGVTTNSVSKSFESMPGIKGIGQLGANLKFENEGSLGSSTGTSASASASEKTTTSVSVQHTITKTNKNQFVVYTPLYTHKVFKVAWGGRKPASGNAVDPSTLSQGYIHVYKHTPVPHVKVFDTPTKNPKIKLGLYNFPDHVEV